MQNIYLAAVHAVDGGGVDVGIVDFKFLADENVINGLLFILALKAVVSVADFSRVKALIDICQLDVVEGVEVLAQNPDRLAVGLTV